MTSPNHPVIVGASQLANHNQDAEPIAMMVDAAKAALAGASSVVEAIDVVAISKGINPYNDPGRLVASQLGLTDVATSHTYEGGNASYDLVNDTAARIASGEVNAAIVCAAETMRTRRSDKAAGRKTTYVDEAPDAQPDRMVGVDTALHDEADAAAGVYVPAHFYAMAESALRHRSGLSNDEHLARIAKLWATGSEVAATNPHATIGEAVDAEAIARSSPSNRRIASPYTKLLTSNINVDQSSALIMCSYDVARSTGIAEDAMVYLVAGSGAYDVQRLRSRLHLAGSNAMRLAGERVLELAGMAIDEFDHVDLYSCFPVAVQVARKELGVSSNRPFTITGGMTFAGGPLNTYPLQAAAHSFDLLRGTDETALLHANGGYFSKEAFVIASGKPPTKSFVYERPQEKVDALAQRPPTDEIPSEGTIEAYTVVFDRDDQPVTAILSILDNFGSRIWATDDDPADMAQLLATEGVTRRVTLEPNGPIGKARLQ